MTPAVVLLLELCHGQQEQIQALRDEVARLKGEKPKPVIKPSALEGERTGQKKGRKPRSRGKRHKTAELEIHESVKRQPAEGVPPNSRFKGYQDFVVQDIRIGVHNTRYRLERWVTPEGVSLIGQLPAEIGGVHFGPQLRTFILYQYHHAHVTQPLLLEQLREWQIDISAGQLSALITDGHTDFHREKDALLQAGLQCSRYVHVDDTGARHQGKNGYCTHVGNERFAWFASTDSKSRINFLELLRAGHDAYT
ncbi:transposase [Candidatus Accumulibacter sp. ACC003]|uniref:transposase n=1 Tax=Candidatus Accumulibacter sp. ACC003 TaxID=2823334 RepID=UPI0025BACB95|nr:transposase [Candidatus Accumulibacter sp. ACC003]